MKRKAFLFLCMLYTLIASAQFSGSGTGTKADPYTIYNAVQLDQVRNYTGSYGAYFKLMDDIDLTEWIADNNPSQGWVPIGNSYDTSFKGTFDGNNHKITGLYIKRSDSDYVGLFGYLSGANIKNLEVEGEINGKDYVGGIAGYFDMNSTRSVGIIGFGIIENCIFRGKISGNDNVGGIVGYGKDSNICNNYCTAEIKGNDYIGGISGCFNVKWWNTTLWSIYEYKKCVFEGTVSGSKYIGGISGILEGYYSKSETRNYDSPAIVEDCFASISIKGVGYIGGITGYMKTAATIQRCAATGNLNISSADSDSGFMGGISGCLSSEVSYDYIKIEDSYYQGKLTGIGTVGGILGYQASGSVSKCYSAAEIEVSEYAGGIVGKAERYKTLQNCISNNSIISGREVARILCRGENSMGNNKALFQTKLYKEGVLTEVSDDKANGTGVGAKTLMYRATYQGLDWNFAIVWNILETESLPYFVWQTAPPVIESGTTCKSTTISGKSINGGTVYVEVDDKTYTATVTNNNWSVTTEPLQAGSIVSVYAKADNLVRSYAVSKTVGYEGEGTEANPYKIYTADDLAGMKEDGCYKLMNNIDVTEYINQHSPSEGWLPISQGGATNFTLDGDGHTINGLWSNRTEDYVGLFGYIAQGTIKNLAIKIADGKSVKGGNYTGALIGRITNANIENVTIVGMTEGENYTGGVIGYCNNSSMNTVTCTGDVKAGKYIGGYTYGGGIIGYTKAGNLTTMMYNGTVSSSTHAYTGGIAGFASAKISKSASTGTVISSGSSSYAGGLIGIIEVGGSLEDSYSSMVVSAMGLGGSAAGAVAVNKGTVTRCYATGNVESQSRSAGVIATNNGTEATISNCVAANNKVVAWISSGIVSRVLGGTVNDAPAPEKNNYALKTMAVSVNGITRTVYDDLINGYAKQQAELTSKATYTSLGWNFTNLWKIDEGNGYPYISYSFLAPTEGNGEIKTTDISQYDNIVYVEDGVTKKGGTTTLSVKLNNTEEVTGFKFNLVLPMGIDVVTDEDDFYLIDLSTERTTTRRTDNFDSEQQSDGSILVTCKSSRNYAFNGNEGEVATIVVKADSQIADDDYAITLRNVELTYSNGTTEKIDNVVSVLTVGDKKVCEVPVITFCNGKIVCKSATEGSVCHHTYKIAAEGEDKDPDDVKISISAYATADGFKDSKVVTKVFNFNSTGGMPGDVNGDGRVTMADANAIVNIVLGK